MSSTRPDVSRQIPEKTRLMLAVLAGGRCEFTGCNDFLFEHHLTRRLGVFGQNAHIVAFGKAGPRARKTKMGTVHDLSNLMLLCPKCHKQIDDEPALFPVEVLAQYKVAHETRIRLVTSLGPDMRTEVLQLKANVGGQPVGIPAPQVYEAVAPRYPADTQGFVIDLTSLQSEDCTFYAAAEKADALVLVTEWRPYQNPDFDRLKASMRRAVLLDGRNIWSGYGLRKIGLRLRRHRSPRLLTEPSPVSADERPLARRRARG